MSRRPIIDAGPGLNFFAINKERLLFDTLGPLSVPETVRDEILRKSRQDERFRAAEVVWRKLPERLMQVLPDDVTPELEAVVRRISRLPMRERLKHRKDLGETMVIAHAVVAAEASNDVTVLIDDGPGAKIATLEIRRLRRLQADGRPVGMIRLISTPTVLERAAGTDYIPNKAVMRDMYARLRGLDDGLPPIEKTNLLSPSIWL
ncbi:hypothetical protein [Thermasporomyces composti]|uniref:Uncharacterized protein n=1 Tax=Thermasporomyces composti TaxID=696763 RepID=A0A3D9V5S8_THECX|nr:hypothetical protein [Thermasporomyces composti]REF37152.1 hypothetical protein DFJ64_2589 [Thermasporomyces composti]